MQKQKKLECFFQEVEEWPGIMQLVSLATCIHVVNHALNVNGKLSDFKLFLVASFLFHAYLMLGKSKEKINKLHLNIILFF